MSLICERGRVIILLFWKFAIDTRRVWRLKKKTVQKERWKKNRVRELYYTRIEYIRRYTRRVCVGFFSFSFLCWTRILDNDCENYYYPFSFIFIFFPTTFVTRPTVARKSFVCTTHAHDVCAKTIFVRETRLLKPCAADSRNPRSADAPVRAATTMRLAYRQSPGHATNFASRPRYAEQIGFQRM